MLPRPVAVGFSTGIAILVVSQQVPALLGIGPQIIADPLPRAALTLIRYPAQIEPHTIILAFSTLILITACRRASRYIPTSLIAITTGALLVKFGHFPVRTIESLFGSDLRSFHLHLAGAFRLDLLGSILAQGFAIAVLVAIESGHAMGLAANFTGERFNSNGELFVQGGVNIASAFAGGAACFWSLLPHVRQRAPRSANSHCRHPASGFPRRVRASYGPSLSVHSAAGDIGAYSVKRLQHDELAGSTPVDRGSAH